MCWEFAFPNKKIIKKTKTKGGFVTKPSHVKVLCLLISFGCVLYGLHRHYIRRHRIGCWRVRQCRRHIRLGPLSVHHWHSADWRGKQVGQSWIVHLLSIERKMPDFRGAWSCSNQRTVQTRSRRVTFHMICHLVVFLDGHYNIIR